MKNSAIFEHLRIQSGDFTSNVANKEIYNDNGLFECQNNKVMEN